MTKVQPISNVIRIKECGGYDWQTKSNIIWFEVFYLDNNNQIQKQIIDNIKDLETE